VVSGHPIATALTDTKGHFVLNNAPVGKSIPVVIQSGRWRRTTFVDVTNTCADNPITDANQTRLPRSSKEGDIPRIALTTGCDQVECALRRIGIDDNEITGPNGGGHVHVYRGQDQSQGLPANPGGAYALFGDNKALANYDIVIASNECSVNARDVIGPAYANMKAYADNGGRFFANGMQYNWFASAQQCGDPSCGGPPEWSSRAEWLKAAGKGPPYNANVSFPRGKAFADWYENIANGPYGVLPLVGAHDYVGNAQMLNPYVIAGTVQSADTHALSFRAPIEKPPMNWNGEVDYMTFDVEGLHSSASSPWPNSCAGSPNGTANSLVFEFLFLSWPVCVQYDPPPIPE
jgi:hypothetical protein